MRMEGKHWHHGIENIIVYGISALIFFNLLKISAAKASRLPGFPGQIGKAVGGLTYFGS
jgi:hypothetical protein